MTERTDDSVVREDVRYDAVLPGLLQQPDRGLRIPQFVASSDGGVVRHLQNDNRDVTSGERRQEQRGEA